MLDKPLPVIFPELNSLQIGLIRELMKREYERGLAVRIPEGRLMSTYHDLYSGKTKEWTEGFRSGYNTARTFSENYTPNVEENK